MTGDRELRAYAERLAQSGDPEIRERALAVLKRQDPTVTKSAPSVDQELVKYAKRLAQSGDPEMRAMAETILGADGVAAEITEIPRKVSAVLPNQRPVWDNDPGVNLLRQHGLMKRG